jgi:hypothetical protein
MRSIPYKIEYSTLELVFGLIGPAIILLSIFYAISNLKIGKVTLQLPPGVASGVLALLGLYLTYSTVSSIFKKRAANSLGANIVLDDKARCMRFTAVQKFRGELVTVNYDAITTVVTTIVQEDGASEQEKKITFTVPSMTPNKFEFDADHMARDSDFDELVSMLKYQAVNATFRVNQ